ncbi:telomerase-binding protein EST1A [Aplysia californica]|uniref:Telomerase-binding protein EST1A n=1 Tax=Aplysia californica TaxID=6500 RepID=A0ABM0JKX6_APLCA|nr:telomerase-binding protein EST1A [Aplysia californica]
MATEDIVRISYADLERIASSLKQDTQEDSEKNVEKTGQQKQSKAKRPAQQIYRPGQLRQNRGPRDPGRSRDEGKESQHGEYMEEDWDNELKGDSTEEDRAKDSREGSGDIEENDVQEKLDDLYISSPPRESCASPVSDSQSVEGRGDMSLVYNNGNEMENASSSKRALGSRGGVSKRRGKRPDLQRYIPRARLSDRDRKSEEKEFSPEAVQNEDGDQEEDFEKREKDDGEVVVSTAEDSSGALTPRKVQVKSRGGAMRVTVMNESMSSSPGQDNKTPPTVSRQNIGPQRKNVSQQRQDSKDSLGSDQQGKLYKNLKDSESDRKSFGRSERSGRQFYEGGKGRTHQEPALGGRGRGDHHRRNDQPVKSYTRMRRSNSSDSRRSDNAEPDPPVKVLEKGQFTSGTFPRTKPSGSNSYKSGAKDVYSSGKSNKDIASTGKSGGREGEKFYWGMRRQRTGSISSEASVASNLSNGSFYSGSSDFGTEDDEPEQILDWCAEVEKAHLEELARIVHDGTQKLTSSLDAYPDLGSESVAGDAVSGNIPSSAVSTLNRQKSVSADKIHQVNPKEGRTRRRNRQRKPSSRQGSRDSSVHSAAHGEDGRSEGGRRRRRRRHSSRSSQGGSQYQDDAFRRKEQSDGGSNMSGLQVTIGRRHRHVELNKGRGGNTGNSEKHKGENKSLFERLPRDHQYEPADWDGEQSMEFNRSSDRFPPQKWQKEPPPRFRRDSGGGSGESGGGGRRRRGSGIQQGREGDRVRHESEGSWCGVEEEDSLLHDNSSWRGAGDQRSVHPAHDASPSSGAGGRGRGRNSRQKQEWRGGERSSGGHHHHHHIGHDFSSGLVNHDDFAINHRARGGGVLHLPPREEPPRPHSNPSASMTDYFHHRDNHHNDSGGGGAFGSNVRGMTQGQKHLFDPNNPSKPIVIPDSAPAAPPKFEDTEDNSSPLGPGSGPVASSPEGQHGHPGYPGQFYPPDFPHPAYCFRPPVRPFGPPHGSYPMGSFPPRAMPPHMFFRFPRMPVPDMAFYNGGDGDGEGMMSSGSRSQSRMMAEQILRDSVPFESQLGNILSRRPHSDDSHRMVNQIRAELQNRLEQVILLDIEVANKQNVEQTLWKSVYYQVIESNRKKVSDESANSLCKKRLAEVLDEGTRFFENLLKKLQSTYEFDLDQYTESHGPVPETSSRYVKLALLSSQRVMMFLGDIARYREQLADTTNYGKARHWYLKAQKIHPRNGRPYNQLAILAVYTRRKLDAVYYYMRSLAASNPIMTARESLMSLFDEVRRKVDAMEKKKFEERRQRQQLRKKRPSAGPRVEIWVSPDGSSMLDSVEDGDEEEDLSSLSAIELNKRFVLTYLNVHGKLFTKINFEVFAESSSLMLHEFLTLIQHSPCVLSSTRLLQLMVINMFSVDNTTLKDSSLEENCRSLLQEHAVEIGLEMFGLLVQRCSDLLSLQLKKVSTSGEKSACSPSESSHSEDPLSVVKNAGGGTCNGQLGEDLHNILPALKTWVEWMMCHAHLWNPQPLNRPPDLGPQIDVWKNLATFCDLLNAVETQQGCLIREEKPGYKQVVLHEDTTLAGFVPMLSAPQETFYASVDVDKRQAEDWLRIEKLRLFGEYLCGVEPPMLAFNVESGRYYSVAPSPVRSEEKLVADGEDGKDKDSGEESDDVIIEHGSSSGEGSDGNDHIEKLKAKRGELHRRKQERERNKESMDAILDSHRHAKIELEIRPIFLVADTNCFIDHFSTLKKILETKKYTLVVPLVVINELDGLSRGARDQQYDSPDHANMVKTQASQAVQFLEAEFEVKNSHLRAQTAKGTVLETIAFRSEESDGSAGINDDIILSCCLHYCKDMAREFMPKGKDQPVRLYRDVVLLTEDRNLRLKAHTCNVPVKDVPGFKKWSKIS